MRGVVTWVGAVVALGLLIAPAAAERRLALVVGNNSYSNLPEAQQLKTAVNDANAVGDALARLGFTVTRGENLSRSEFSARLDVLIRSVQPGDTVAFYFAGHGVSLGGGNYLLPSDVPPVESGQESLLARASLGEDDIVGDIQARGARVVIEVLDACRDNPFRQDGRRSVGGAQGLTRMEAARGVFKLYSAGIGQTALDRLNRSDGNPNSVFTRVLLPELVKPGRDLTALARDVGREVLRLAASVGHEQQPAYYDQILDSVYLAGAPAEPGKATPALLPASPGAPGEAERAWAVTKDSTDREVLEEFIRRFGSDYYASLARARLRELESRSAAAATSGKKEGESGPAAIAPSSAEKPAAPAPGHDVAATACRVVASEHLDSEKFAFQYQGGCKAGLAEGRGRASWSLWEAPERTEATWEGRFAGGIYLPDPPGIVSARQAGRNNARKYEVFFGLGSLPPQAGIPAAKVTVETRSELTSYADPCIARRVFVSNVPLAALASDSVVQAVMAAAVEKLRTRCGEEITRVSRSQRPQLRPRSHLDVLVVATAEVGFDSSGDPDSIVAYGDIPLTPGETLRNYGNQVAAQLRKAEVQKKDEAARKLNAQRLRGFFQAQQARMWVQLGTLDQNPFRYAEGVVVTAVALDRVVSRSSALVSDIHPGSGVHAVIEGARVAQWARGARVVAVRVLDRVRAEDENGGRVRLQLVASESCAEEHCEDWLKLPVELGDGQMP
ncbi:MAG: caspase family protein [Alphaproteobacteria bacterium]|nr:caspase family protein [Alphaproteobacteria bacterium]